MSDARVKGVDDPRQRQANLVDAGWWSGVSAAAALDADAELTLSFRDALRGGTWPVAFRDGGSGLVQVPPGVWDGQVLRLARDADAPAGLGRADDRQVWVHVTPDPSLRREGRDLHAEIVLTVDEAVRGTVRILPGANGDVRCRVPPGTCSGHVLRVRDAGVASHEGVPCGHLYVTVQVAVPTLAPDDVQGWAALAVLAERQTASR
ncbi:MAG: molecular chaperone DnaJ [Pseudomonadota bacterium]